MHDLKVWEPEAALGKVGAYSPNSAVLPISESFSTYSIKREFDGANVLLTGASGYIGSVVLEQMLRTTNVASVRCLMRDKKDERAEQRIAKVMQGSLFHKVRESKKLLGKVSVVKGDILLPNLGLSPAEREQVVNDVDMIIHCAADIRLEVNIQETLLANFEGTRTILELAASMRHLRSLVHVSSAFVNMNFPRSSIVNEQVYPLKHGEQETDAEELAKELMSLPRRDANNRAKVYVSRWNFPNNYTLGKHLTEQLVARYQAKYQLPVVIVRPSLVCAIAGEPYPGYAGNWAGPIGAGAAMAIGLFDCLGSVASRPLHVWDIIPADQVASIILASSAAASAGVTAEISNTTGAGSIYRDKAPAAAAAAAAGVATGAAPAVACGGKPQAARGGLATKRSRSGILTDDSAMSDYACSDGMVGAGFSCTPETSAATSPTAAATVTLPLTSQLLAAAVSSINRRQEQQRTRNLPLLIVHAATSSTYPLTLMEGWNYNLEFFAAHPPAFSITYGKLPEMPADFEPKVSAVLSCRRWTGYKVWAITSLLRLFGKEKEAKKLALGFETFCVHNNAKTDRDLTFSTHGLCGLAERLDPAEAHEFCPLVWRPISGREGADLKGHLAGLHGDISWRRYVHTQMAGIYRMVFGISVPQLGHMALGPDQEEPSQDQLIKHDFVAIR